MLNVVRTPAHAGRNDVYVVIAKRAMRKHYNSEEKIKVALDRLRG